MLVEIDSIDRAQLPQWIGERLARQQQRAGAEALEFIADRVEGNLLAAHQEIAKLGAAASAGRADAGAGARQRCSNVARYDVFQLPLAMLGGDAARVRRRSTGLEAEGEAIPLVLWAVTEELRTLIRVKAQVQAGRPFSMAARENRVWGPRERLVERLLPRLSAPALADGARAGRADRPPGQGPARPGVRQRRVARIDGSRPQHRGHERRARRRPMTASAAPRSSDRVAQQFDGDLAAYMTSVGKTARAAARASRRRAAPRRTAPCATRPA